MNNKATVIGIMIVIFSLGVVFWIARPDPQKKTTSLSFNKVLVAEETNFDFGEISMAAGKVKHSFKIENVSSEPVTILKMYTSCMCTTAALMMGGKTFGPYGMPGHGFIPGINKIIGKGEEATIEIVFDPAAHGPAGVGRIEREVTIENNAGQPLGLGFTAFVTP